MMFEYTESQIKAHNAAFCNEIYTGRTATGCAGARDSTNSRNLCHVGHGCATTLARVARMLPQGPQTPRGGSRRMAENTEVYARKAGGAVDVRQLSSPHGVGPSSPAHQPTPIGCIPEARTASRHIKRGQHRVRRAARLITEAPLTPLTRSCHPGVLMGVVCFTL